MSIRLRFAPSPTGFLHLGGARTALFNWLLARHTGGTFVLRIEDTDRARSAEAHTRAILDGLAWLGLDVDEGPFFQSEGVERHAGQARRLLAEGKAYRDFSDPEELRAEAARLGIGHPSSLARRWADEMEEEESRRRAEAGRPFAIRLRVPEGVTVWDDLVRGPMRFENADLDDFVILRSDGSPVYNLAVVSDDAEQRIDTVIRGDDHLSNTPKQILLYRALGLPEPAFGHVPMILGPDGKRLSKRHGATAVEEYAAKGIVRDALVNYLALLGWNPGDDAEVMDRETLIERFSIERVQRTSAVFDTAKLEWMNGHYLAGMGREALLPLFIDALRAEGWEEGAWRERPPGWLGELADLLKVRARTLREMVAQAAPFLGEVEAYDEKAVAKHFEREPDAVLERLAALSTVLAEAPEWEEDLLEEGIRVAAKEHDVGAGKMIHPLRLAVTGKGESPGIFEVLVLLGREVTLARVAAACKHLYRGPSQADATSDPGAR
ncbi:MAG: glutamate--tRNA ligase [Longimicrobiales bacterium]|nr:glutamate--tRNA ligase [Longimicrobiales bacterium]